MLSTSLIAARYAHPLRSELVAAGGLLEDRKQARGTPGALPGPAAPPAHCAWELTAANASSTATSGSTIVSASAITNSRRTAHHSTRHCGAARRGRDSARSPPNTAAPATARRA